MANRRGGKKSTRQSAIATIQKQLKGAVIRPRTDPSAITEHPWNSWTYERKIEPDSGSTLATTTGDVFERIRGQGLQGVGDIEMKISECRIWNITSNVPSTTANPHTGLGVPSIEVTFWDFGVPGTDQDRRAIVRDTGTFTIPATVGYIYPITDSKQVFNTTETATLVQSTLLLGNTWTELVVRMNILYRPMNAAASSSQIMRLMNEDGIIAPGLLQPYEQQT